MTSKTGIPSLDSLARDLGQKFAFPASTKTYLQGSRPDIRAPIRLIQQQDTLVAERKVPNPPIPVYDTSGPYSDPEVVIKLEHGLEQLRAGWIVERGDTDLLPGPTSEYGRARSEDPATRHLRFAHIGAPRCGKAGANVTQMHYARRGIVTPEMEFVALRESVGLEDLRRDPRYKQLLKQHPGNGFGARLPEVVTPEFVRQEVAAGRAIIPANINHPEIEPMIIGRNFRVKINGNLGNSAVTSSINEDHTRELEPVHTGGRRALTAACWSHSAGAAFGAPADGREGGPTKTFAEQGLVIAAAACRPARAGGAAVLASSAG